MWQTCFMGKSVKRMPYVKLDKDGLIEEDSPCWNCENAYVEEIWFEWACKAKERPYQEEQEKQVK